MKNLLLFFAFFLCYFSTAETVNYQLEIDQSQLIRAGKENTVLTINGTSPGPTLRFKLGEKL
jgi:hypothetical protein